MPRARYVQSKSALRFINADWVLNEINRAILNRDVIALYRIRHFIDVTPRIGGDMRFWTEASDRIRETIKRCSAEWGVPELFEYDPEKFNRNADTLGPEDGFDPVTGLCYVPADKLTDMVGGDYFKERDERTPDLTTLIGGPQNPNDYRIRWEPSLNSWVGPDLAPDRAAEWSSARNLSGAQWVDLFPPPVPLENSGRRRAYHTITVDVASGTAIGPTWNPEDTVYEESAYPNSRPAEGNASGLTRAEGSDQSGRDDGAANPDTRYDVTWHVYGANS